VTENHEIVELLSSSNSISSVCKDGENVAFRKMKHLFSKVISVVFSYFIGGIFSIFLGFV